MSGKLGKQPAGKKTWATAIVMFMLAAGLLGFMLRPGAAKVTTQSLPLATAKKGEFLVIIACRGELVAEKSKQITAPLNVPNLQIVWMVEPGSAVKPGDPVLRFDDSGAKQQLQDRIAIQRQIQAALDQSIAAEHITIEQDKLDQYTLQQVVERARLEASKSEIVSAIQAEENKVDLAIARERLKVEAAAVALHAASSKSRIAAYTSQRDKAKDEVEVVRQRLEKMEVRSPAAGIVNFLINSSQGAMNAKPFKVGDSVWPGSAIAEIPNLATLRLKGKTEEIDRGKMHVGQDVRILLDPFPEMQYKGKLELISPLTEQTFEWPASRNFRAYASIGQEDPRLRPAMNGRMDVIVDRIQNAISVPAKAIFARDGRPVVLVPSKDGLKPVKVEVLARNPDEVAVKGIEAGTEVALVESLSEKKKK